MEAGAVLVCGSASGVGKSTIVAGLARRYARAGRSVAPFKAQNMSNHAAVTADGGEVGRAQAMQAAAASVEVTVDMNPILLKPSTDRASHVVVLGRQVDTTDAVRWGAATQSLKPIVLDALRRLRHDHDIVVAEGAGGAAEINLLGRDLVNLPLAAAAGIPTVLVVDIDRGGAFAAAHGTIDLVPPALRATIGGIIINRFRGDPALLTDGLEMIARRTGVPVLGVLPHLGPGVLLGTEDSLDIGAGSFAVSSDDGDRPPTTTPLRIAVVRFPHLSNPSDLDPLAVERDVVLRWATAPGDIVDADLVILPGSRATIADLAWLRATGLADAIATSTADVIGICAGAQMLGVHIRDGIESAVRDVDGLGLIDAVTRFGPDKQVARRHGVVEGSRTPVVGYQIHQGRTTTGASPWLRLDRPSTHSPGAGVDFDGGVTDDGRIHTTSLHGIFDADDVRTELLADIATRHGRGFVPSTIPFAERLEDQHERLADWVTDHLDVEAVDALVATAVPVGSEPGWA